MFQLAVKKLEFYEGMPAEMAAIAAKRDCRNLRLLQLVLKLAWSLQTRILNPSRQGGADRRFVYSSAIELEGSSMKMPPKHP
jgi:hypothetical protein